ncbi:MAG: DHHA1 domain-containing protein, partial [Eubacteriales bacterium]|nr:DHHA1 domain-containing protein [Eubacteriales bacterium]
DRVRFDFSHFAAMTEDERAKVEAIVNRNILAGLPGSMTEMPIEEAKKLGAMALFGEKYGDIVRVVRFGDVSCEFCGGTHLDNTAKIGLFRLTGEGSVAAGIRRVEGVTGQVVLELLYARERTIASAAETLRSTPAEIEHAAQAAAASLREQKAQIEALEAKIARADAEALIGSAEDVGGLRLIARQVPGTAEQMRGVCDTLRDMNESVVVLLGAAADGKVVLSAACGKEAVKRGAHAGKLVKAAASLVGGGGGGRPDSASAGGRNAEKLPEALASARATLEGLLK